MAEKRLTSVQELADKVKIPRKTISNWLRLTRSPQIDSLVVLAKFFDVSVDFLLGLEDELGNKV